MFNGFMEKLVAGRWIAGPTVDDVIERGKRFNRLGIGAIMNYLGEALTDQKDIKDAMDNYREILRKVKKNDPLTQISVKPTQIGLSVSLDMAKKNFSEIVKLAGEKGIFTWVDMEESELVDNTIELYESQLPNENIGLCVQAYLKRTYDDVKRLTEKGGTVRLVKGAYTEPETVAYKTKEDIDKNYVEIMKYLFDNAKKFMIASHDDKIIEKAREINKEKKKEVWYAMLNGIRNQYLIQLQKAGEKTFSYIPFGKKWIQYSVRRMQEAGHMSLLMKSILHGQKI
ncbi:proline dehydrogenase family protein [Cuniculiplasma sp. SKW3]|uniref:proline dehydrogenase family protein n=1 Tax=unclassified Cuniculiplasma TaxID=2619706 RepID=UPI003FD2D78D